MWDHIIDVKKGLVPRKRKIYPLLREKRGEIHEFINKQLRKEYIRLLKSPQMTLVLFVRKKDSKKYMVQDYMYLNKWTVKNNYLLSLISDIVENISVKKIFIRFTIEV